MVTAEKREPTIQKDALYTCGLRVGAQSSFSHSLNDPLTFGVKVQLRWR